MATIYYSPSTNGFYFEGLHTTIPDDKVEVTEAEYKAQVESEGEPQHLERVPGPNGKPTGKPRVVLEPVYEFDPRYIAALKKALGIDTTT